ncbi:MAG TPA: ABC transporter substrate-binding protein [Stellaceae bacterium]|nr:ABC transporter substrate-binding protein [Stellaceae bacterium]
MRRRAFITGSAAALAGAAGATAAQQRLPHVVYLWLGAPGTDGPTRSGLQVGLADLGYREGRTIRLDYRYADGSAKKIAELAAATVDEHPDLIIAPGTVVTNTLAKLTATIPVVSASGDPVGLGFARSLAHPGGNITGLAVEVGPELAGKWLELIAEIAPGARQIAVLANASNANMPRELAQMREAAGRIGGGIGIEEYAIRNVADLPATLATMLAAKPDAVIVENDPLLIGNSATIAARAGRLPTVCGNREFVSAGGLIAYGTSIFDMWRRGATYIDRILKGESPADLPIELPTNFELVINMKTAKALGLAVPQSLLARADEVIE